MVKFYWERGFRNNILFYVLIYLFLGFLETEAWYVAQADLSLTEILLPQPPRAGITYKCSRNNILCKSSRLKFMGLRYSIVIELDVQGLVPINFPGVYNLLRNFKDNSCTFQKMSQAQRIYYLLQMLLRSLWVKKKARYSPSFWILHKS